jgi:hypothetical protein
MKIYSFTVLCVIGSFFLLNKTLSANYHSTTIERNTDTPTDTSFNWTKIKVTENQQDIGIREKKGNARLKFESPDPHAKAEELERACISELKRKAFKLKGTILLVLEKHVSINYGELPSIEIVAEVY